ncbi:unnamed protein product [Schistosoma margrebowiei]|uniref:Uncharacterized protein n=1 Tax=Schistosoma margrebowiei TaxID=48269 RepID=A0A3P7YRA4_9TREM|nr:unnamed protein product [Schistosoma margrebowiei]
MDTGFVLLGTHQQGVPVILKELVLPGVFDPVSPSFTVRGVTTELFEPRMTAREHQFPQDYRYTLRTSVK